MSIQGKNVINGTFGTAYVDGFEIFQVKGFQAKVNFEKADIKIAGKFGTSTKVTGWNGKGSISLYKTTSQFYRYVSEMIKGKTVSFDFTSRLADPDALGYETVVVKGCVLDDSTLADWEGGKIGETECPFTFEDYYFEDKIV